jgi:hypothetical protein
MGASGRRGPRMKWRRKRTTGVGVRMPRPFGRPGASNAVLIIYLDFWFFVGWEVPNQNTYYCSTTCCVFVVYVICSFSMAALPECSVALVGEPHPLEAGVLPSHASMCTALR